MWLFPLSEILIFGGLFLLYAVYRSKHPADFHAASLELSRFDGTLNTAILLTSSLTGVTVTTASLNFGRVAIIVVLAIAAGKSTLVLLYFMHLSTEKRLLLKLLVPIAVITLAIFIGLTYTDILNR